MNQRSLIAKRAGKAWGFTLIELLAVIAIIAVLAGLVLGLAGLATVKSRDARMRGEHQKLVSNIEEYKAAMGNYPPDNQDTTLDRIERAGRNSLFYELSGATFENTGGGQFTTQNKSETIKADDLKKAFGVKGVENSARNKKDIPFRGVTFKANQYADLDPWENAQILITPLKGPYDSKFKKKGPGSALLNPWFYDASSTNRHNMDTYDLWSEYLGRDRTNVVGNWKD